jgi:hypothetical protein
MHAVKVKTQERRNFSKQQNLMTAFIYRPDHRNGSCKPRKVWQRVLQDLELRMTALARASGNLPDHSEMYLKFITTGVPKLGECQFRIQCR